MVDDPTVVRAPHLKDGINHRAVDLVDRGLSSLALALAGLAGLALALNGSGFEGDAARVAAFARGAIIFQGLALDHALALVDR
eukprot:1770852-Heterocapsa_arctica.AAC.1